MGKKKYRRFKQPSNYYISKFNRKSKKEICSDIIEIISNIRDDIHKDDLIYLYLELEKIT